MTKKLKIPLTEPGTGQALISWVTKSIIPHIDTEAARRGLSRSAFVKELVLNFFAQNDKTPADNC